LPSALHFQKRTRTAEGQVEKRRHHAGIGYWSLAIRELRGTRSLRSVWHPLQWTSLSPPLADAGKLGRSSSAKRLSGGGLSLVARRQAAKLLLWATYFPRQR